MDGKKERWNFYLLWRFSPRRNSKLNSICLDLNKRWQKITSNIFVLFLFVFATETWAKRASTRLRGGNVSSRYWRDRLQRGNKRMYTVGVRVCACMSACVKRVNGQLVNTFLGTKLFQPVLWGNVQMLCGLAKKKKLADVSTLTREWKNCPYPCVIVVPFKDVWSNRGDHHKHQLTGRAARSLSVTCVADKITAVAASWIVSGEK